MLTTSLTPASEILTPSLRLWPAHPTLRHYAEVLQAAPWLRYFWNTAVVSAASALSILFTSSLAGFIFAKYAFPGRTLLFILVLGTAMIPLNPTRDLLHAPEHPDELLDAARIDGASEFYLY